MDVGQVRLRVIPYVDQSDLAAANQQISEGMTAAQSRVGGSSARMSNSNSSGSGGGGGVPPRGEGFTGGSRPVPMASDFRARYAEANLDSGLPAASRVARDELAKAVKAYRVNDRVLQSIRSQTNLRPEQIDLEKRIQSQQEALIPQINGLRVTRANTERQLGAMGQRAYAEQLSRQEAKDKSEADRYTSNLSDARRYGPRSARRADYENEQKGRRVETEKEISKLKPVDSLDRKVDRLVGSIFRNAEMGAAASKSAAEVEKEQFKTTAATGKLENRLAAVDQRLMGSTPGSVQEQQLHRQHIKIGDQLDKENFKQFLKEEKHTDALTGEQAKTARSTGTTAERLAEVDKQLFAARTGTIQEEKLRAGHIKLSNQLEQETTSQQAAAVKGTADSYRETLRETTRQLSRREQVDNAQFRERIAPMSDRSRVRALRERAAGTDDEAEKANLGAEAAGFEKSKFLSAKVSRRTLMMGLYGVHEIATAARHKHEMDLESSLARDSVSQIKALDQGIQQMSSGLFGSLAGGALDVLGMLGGPIDSPMKFHETARIEEEKLKNIEASRDIYHAEKMSKRTRDTASSGAAAQARAKAANAYEQVKRETGKEDEGLRNQLSETTTAGVQKTADGQTRGTPYTVLKLSDAAARQSVTGKLTANAQVRRTAFKEEQITIREVDRGAHRDIETSYYATQAIGRRLSGSSDLDAAAYQARGEAETLRSYARSRDEKDAATLAERKADAVEQAVKTDTFANLKSANHQTLSAAYARIRNGWTGAATPHMQSQMDVELSNYRDAMPYAPSSDLRLGAADAHFGRDSLRARHLASEADFEEGMRPWRKYNDKTGEYDDMNHSDPAWTDPVAVRTRRDLRHQRRQTWNQDDRDAADSLRLQGMSMRTRMDVAGIASTDMSTLSSGRQQITSITGNALQEAEQYRLRGNPGDEELRRGALELGQSNLTGFKANYLKGIRAEEANINRVDLSAENTVDVRKLFAQADKDSATLGNETDNPGSTGLTGLVPGQVETNKLLDRIANILSNLSTGAQ